MTRRNLEKNPRIVAICFACESSQTVKSVSTFRRAISFMDYIRFCAAFIYGKFDKQTGFQQALKPSGLWDFNTHTHIRPLQHKTWITQYELTKRKLMMDFYKQYFHMCWFQYLLQNYRFSLYCTAYKAMHGVSKKETKLNMDFKTKGHSL